MHVIIAGSISLLLCTLTAAVPQPPGKGIGGAIAITKQSALVNADGGVNMEKLRSHVAFVKAKHGLNNAGEPHHTATKETKKRATGAEPLIHYQKKKNTEMWYGGISVGTPAKSFSVEFDTGSSDLFLPGPGCNSKGCEGHKKYDPDDSDTSSPLNRTFKIEFEDDSYVSGKLFNDTIAIAGLTVSEQTLGVASTYSDDLNSQQYAADGLMGMAFREDSNYSANPVFQNLIAEGQTSKPEFAFKLASSASGGSELYLGGVNPALYTGGFTPVPRTEAGRAEGTWKVTMDSIQRNGGAAILKNIISVIDTGTTLIVGDLPSVEKLYNELGGTKVPDSEDYYMFKCDSFPNISFTFGGRPFTISVDNLKVGFYGKDKSYCVSGIIGEDLDEPTWLVGDVFLKNVYTKFNVGEQRVEFALLA